MTVGAKPKAKRRPNKEEPLDLQSQKKVRASDLPPVSYDKDNPALLDEQQVARCEILMSRGVRANSVLRKLLNEPDHRKVKRYIDRVEARWEILGSDRNHAKRRGEGLFRLDQLEQKAWTLIDMYTPTKKTVNGVETITGGDPRIVLQAIKQVAEIQAHRATLLGMTPKVIEKLTLIAQAPSSPGGSIPEKVASQANALRLVSRITEMLGGPRGTADGAAQDIEDADYVEVGEKNPEKSGNSDAIIDDPRVPADAGLEDPEAKILETLDAVTDTDDLDDPSEEKNPGKSEKSEASEG